MNNSCSIKEKEIKNPGQAMPFPFPSPGGREAKRRVTLPLGGCRADGHHSWPATSVALLGG